MGNLTTFLSVQNHEARQNYGNEEFQDGPVLLGFDLVSRSIGGPSRHDVGLESLGKSSLCFQKFMLKPRLTFALAYRFFCSMTVRPVTCNNLRSPTPKF